MRAGTTRAPSSRGRVTRPVTTATCSAKHSSREESTARTPTLSKPRPRPACRRRQSARCTWCGGLNLGRTGSRRCPDSCSTESRLGRRIVSEVFPGISRTMVWKSSSPDFGKKSERFARPPTSPSHRKGYRRETLEFRVKPTQVSERITACLVGASFLSV